MKYFNTQLIITSLLGLSLIGCGDTNSNNNEDTELSIFIKSEKLTGNALQGKVTPHISDAKAQLGMHLFFSKSLGADRDSACVTCHHPLLGGGDNLSLSIGVGAVNADILGKGRRHDASSSHYDGGPLVPRNAPTTFNIAGWNSVLFHDGRVAHITSKNISTPDSGHLIADELATKNLASAQSRFPITSPEEMKGFNHENKDNQEIREYVASRLGGYGEGKDELKDTGYWLNKFQTALNEPNGSSKELITEQNIAMLIGEYENSQVFTNTPWKDYVEGDKGAISTSAKAGAILFYKSIKEGGANCVSCHSGDFFTDEKFYNIAMPQLGNGKGDGDEGIEDFGCLSTTGIERDKYAFRTPSLLNVEVTGPWGHTGAYTSLEGVIRHHLNPKEAIQNYDASQLSQIGLQNLDKLKVNSIRAIEQLEKDRVAGLDVLQDSNLSNEQVNNLVEFLYTLTDPCVLDESCLAKWIPKPNQDPNGDQLDAIDAKGNVLGRE